MAITTKCNTCGNKDLEVRFSLDGIVVLCHICEKAVKIGRIEQIFDNTDIKEAKIGQKS